MDFEIIFISAGVERGKNTIPFIKKILNYCIELVKGIVELIT